MALPRTKEGPVISPDLLELCTPYVPNILLEALSHNPKDDSWIAPVEGSLLLADISGFTPMTEKLSEVGKEGAEWLTNIINHYFQKMLDISTEYGGDNLKFGGDALLILFRGENHALRAVATASAMQRATRQFKVFRVGNHRIRLKMTVGVHSGTFHFATAGIPGYSMQHFILGPETNRVGEIQSTASSGQLIVSRFTMDIVSPFCEAEPMADNYLVHRVSARPRSPIRNDTKVSMQAEKLLPYLPAPVVQSLNNIGKIRTVEGEHRKVTIIFINLMGINDLLTKSGPPGLRKELNEYINILLQLCDKYDGFLSSNDVYTNGFKLILVFGAPVAHEHDTANALRLASELNEELAKSGLSLQHKIGINTGFVFAGDVGSPYRRQYTIMGDAVNLSARLMSSCSPGQILVSKPAMLEAGARFVSIELPPIKVKGKNEPIAIYELKREQDVELTKAGYTTGPLLGRDDEVRIFRRACRRVESGKGRVVTVSGEAGIGKSRLIREFQEHVEKQGWTLYAGICQSHTVSTPFTPWVEILRLFFDLNTEDSLESRTQKVLLKLTSLCPELVESASLLNGILNLTIPESDVVSSLNDESRRQRLFSVIVRLLRKCAEGNPVFVLIEDLHWADHSSIELINHMGNAIKDSRVMMCLSYRPADDKKLKLPVLEAVSIPLGELAIEDATHFVQNALSRTDLPEVVMDAILSKARGNPLFLEETAMALNNTGTVDRIFTSSAVESSKIIASLNIPDRIQTMIMSRIDTLDDVTKEVVRAASIVGSTFDISTLEPVLSFSRSEINLEDCLMELLKLDIVVLNQDKGHTSYRFKSTLVQEVAYDSLLFARRRELHLQIGKHLEKTNRSDLEKVYEILVHHFSKGRDRGKTQFYSLRAAEKVRRVFAYEEAIDFYRCGLNTIESNDWQGLSLRSYFTELIADCYEVSGSHDQAIDNLQVSLRKWRQAVKAVHLPASITLTTGDKLSTRVREAVLSHKIGVSHERNSDYDSSLKWLDIAEEALPSKHPLQAAKVYVTKSVALFRKGRCEEAINWGEKGLILARRSRDLSQLAYAHSMLAASYVVSGNLKRALRHRLAALRLYEKLDDIAGLAVANNNLGGAYWNMGMMDKALQHYEVSLEACQRMGNPVRIAIASNNIGEVLIARGQIQEATNHLQRVVDIYEKRGDPLAVTGLAFINLSRASQSQKDYHQAMEYLKKGRGLLRKVRMLGLLTEARIQEADLRFELGNTEAADRICREALKDSRKLGMKILEARALRTLGRVSMKRKGGLARAEINLKESIDLAEKNKSDYEKALSLLYFGELLIGRKTTGQIHRGKRAVGQAVNILRKIGAEVKLQEALELQRTVQ